MTHCFTDAVIRNYTANRNPYPGSSAQFRTHALITFLQRDLGLRFRQDKRHPDARLEPADCFLYGLVQGHGGTCASLPLLYVAIGRRLGYPLFLVLTRGHQFVRWDEGAGGECFNIEASGDGVSFFPDEYYRSGQFAMPEATIQACGYLKSLSPLEEVANFLVQRGSCWLDLGNYAEAAASFANSHELDPRREQHAFLTWQTLSVWHDQLVTRMPAYGFPILDIIIARNSFPSLPRPLERHFHRLCIQERLLEDEEMARCWWQPLRDRPCVIPRNLPKRIQAVCHENLEYQIHIPNQP